jgi:hypothetical protein
MERSFRSRLLSIDEVSYEFLNLLVALGGYCTAQQTKSLLRPGPGTQARARMRTLERLGFLRRVTKYPVVYQATKATTRLFGRDSSIRRRHTLETVQARLLGVHFYLEARAWPTTFVFDHEEKIEVFRSIECPLSVLPQRDGKPYLRESFLFWLPNWRIAVAMVDQPGPGVFVRLRLFLRQFLPVLRGCPWETVDLFIVTADQQRRFAYQKLLLRNRAIHKLGMGALTARVKPYSVQPPVPTIAELARPRADEQEAFDEPHEDKEFHNISRNHQLLPKLPKPVCDLIGE